MDKAEQNRTEDSSVSAQVTWRFYLSNTLVVVVVVAVVVAAAAAAEAGL
jgi:hypothetical protein